MDINGIRIIRMFLYLCLHRHRQRNIIFLYVHLDLPVKGTVIF